MDTNALGKSEKSSRINWGGILPELLNSEDRRASRSTWWRYVLILWAVNALAFMLTWIAVTALGEGTVALAIGALWLVCILWSAVVFFVVSIRRWHDMDKRGEWCFIILVPIAGPVWFFVSMAFIPGTQGDNSYGKV